MSHRPYAQGYSSGYEAGTQNPASTSQPQYSSNITSSPSSQRMGQLPLPPPPTSRGFELPPLLRVPKPSSGSVSPSVPRSVTLPSVLNPVPEDGLTERRRKQEELDSPHGRAPTLPPLLNPTHGDANTSGGSAVPHLVERSDRSGRKLLIPKSPLRRAISLSQLNPPSGSINAHTNPFPSSPDSRPYPADSGSSAMPPLPTPPAGMRQGGYGFPSIVPPPSDLPRRFTPDTQRYSASPSPGYSAYDQDENSPTGQSTSGYLSISEHSRAAGRGVSVPPPVVTSGSQLNVPLTSAAGQNTYQMMTLKTTEGDVRFPVDVQAASRVADEKRKRNAGASARFRERRKKKEMEAASTISKLENQIKDISEDAEFYKKERDVLAGIIRGLNGGERQLSTRPASPRLRRNATGPSTNSQTTSSYNTSNDGPHGSPEMGRNVRRRTSSFPMAQAPTSIPQPFGQEAHQAHQQSYAPQSSQIQRSHERLPSSLQSSTSIPMLPPASQVAAYNSTQATGLPPPPPVMQAPPMTGPYNPFASRYESGSSQRPQPHGR